MRKVKCHFFKSKILLTDGIELLLLLLLLADVLCSGSHLVVAALHGLEGRNLVDRQSGRGRDRRIGRHRHRGIAVHSRVAIRHLLGEDWILSGR